MSITENGNKNHMVLANQENIAEFGNYWLSGNYVEHIQNGLVNPLGAKFLWPWSMNNEIW